MTKKFKKRKEYKARDRTQTNEISEAWDNLVYPFPIVNPKLKKEVKEK